MVNHTMPATASAKQSIDIVRTFNEEVFNGRDYDLLTDVESETYRQHGPITGLEIEGVDQSLETMQLFHTAFPDLKATEEFAFSDGDYVCSRYTYTGTHNGEFMGIPATGKRVEVPGTVINLVEDGKIVEAWPTVDFLAVFQQLGVVPATEELAS